MLRRTTTNGEDEAKTRECEWRDREAQALVELKQETLARRLAVCTQSGAQRSTR